MKILHIISGLGVGGAEMLLLRLIRESNGDGTEHRVIVLSGHDALCGQVQSAGAQVEILGMRSGLPQPGFIRRIMKQIIEFEPDVVQTWMYHADLLGGIAAYLARRANPFRSPAKRPALVWAVHHTDFPTLLAAPKLCIVARACAMVSKAVPDLIVCCAEAARASHAHAGYNSSRMMVIHNGFDAHTYRPQPEARLRLRESLGLASNALIVGIVGRYHLLKDYPNFVASAARVCHSNPQCRFVMAGKGVEPDNVELVNMLRDAGLTGACHLLGPRDDIDALIPGFDVLCLSSRSEGFPTVVGEAMACGVPCVATDVGDTRALIGDTGLVVAPADPQALATAMLSLLRLPVDERKHLGALARERIVSTFSIQSTWQNYLHAYTTLLSRRVERQKPAFSDL